MCLYKKHQELRTIIDVCGCAMFCCDGMSFGALFGMFRTLCSRSIIVRTFFTNCKHSVLFCQKKTGLALASGRAELSARARGTQVWTFFYFSDGRRMKNAQRISEKQGMGGSRRKTGEGPQRERDSGTNRTKKRQERRREEGRGGESDLTTTQHARRLQHAILQNPSLSALLAIWTRSLPKVTASSSRY